ncbi:MAG: helix-turn-helix domain-containing protein [Candidatus Heimdallarchaeota archaeon]|nr:helix-turn-helix domain-containing protein [Candidatus Heimdallarchaeota archaeon]
MLPKDFAKHNFLERSRREANPRNRLRLLAMSHLQDGKTLSAVADAVKVHWKTVQAWIKRFREDGFAGLLESPRSGAPKRLNEDQENFIKNKIESLSKNSTGGYITGKDLHEMLCKQMQANCCLRTVYNALHRLNFSWITARSKHEHGNSEIQEKYKKTLVR